VTAAAADEEAAATAAPAQEEAAAAISVTEIMGRDMNVAKCVMSVWKKL
jgi:hypothetical protein